MNAEPTRPTTIVTVNQCQEPANNRPDRGLTLPTAAGELTEQELQRIGAGGTGNGGSEGHGGWLFGNGGNGAAGGAGS
jgi:hypothetical protein